MASGRQVTKIKAAGDVTVDYQVPIGKFSYTEVTAQAAVAGGGDGSGVILEGGYDITASFIYDNDRETFDVFEKLKPKSGTVFLTTDMNSIFTPEAVSIDGGATWVEPRVSGGRWVLGLQASSNTLTPFLFEHRPGEGLAYVNKTTLAVISTHTNANMDAAFTDDAYAAVAVYGSEGTTGKGFNLCVGISRFYALTEFGVAIALTYAYVPAALTTLDGDIIIGNAYSDVSTGYYSILRIVSSVPKRLGFTSPPATSCTTTLIDIYNNTANTAKYMLPVTAGASGHGIMLLGVTSITSRTWAYIYASAIYSTTVTSAYVSSTYGTSLLVGFENDVPLVAWRNATSHFRIITGEETWAFEEATTSLDGTITKTPFSTTETDIVALTDTFGFSGDEYLKTSDVGGTDWLGNVVADTQTITGSDVFTVSSMDAVLPNTQKLLAISIPETDPDIPPTIVSGIMLNSQDKLRVVGDIKFNLNVTGVEQ